MRISELVWRARAVDCVSQIQNTENFPDARPFQSSVEEQTSVTIVDPHVQASNEEATRPEDSRYILIISSFDFCQFWFFQTCVESLPVINVTSLSPNLKQLLCNCRRELDTVGQTGRAMSSRTTLLSVMNDWPLSA